MKSDENNFSRNSFMCLLLPALLVSGRTHVGRCKTAEDLLYGWFRKANGRNGEEWCRPSSWRGILNHGFCRERQSSTGRRRVLKGHCSTSSLTVPRSASWYRQSSMLLRQSKGGEVNRVNRQAPSAW